MIVDDPRTDVHPIDRVPTPPMDHNDEKVSQSTMIHSHIGQKRALAARTDEGLLLGMSNTARGLGRQGNCVQRSHDLQGEGNGKGLEKFGSSSSWASSGSSTSADSSCGSEDSEDLKKQVSCDEPQQVQDAGSVWTRVERFQVIATGLMRLMVNVLLIMKLTMVVIYQVGMMVKHRKSGKITVALEPQQEQGDWKPRSISCSSTSSADTDLVEPLKKDDSSNEGGGEEEEDEEEEEEEEEVDADDEVESDEDEIYQNVDTIEQQEEIEKEIEQEGVADLLEATDEVVGVANLESVNLEARKDSEGSFEDAEATILDGDIFGFVEDLDSDVTFVEVSEEEPQVETETPKMEREEEHNELEMTEKRRKQKPVSPKKSVSFSEILTTTTVYEQEQAKEENDDLAVPKIVRENSTICDYRGVSVRWLLEFLDRLLAGLEAPGVSLVTISESHPTLPGRTGRIIDYLGDLVILEIPYFGQAIVPLLDVTFKPRHLWQTEEVCEFVVKGNPEVMRDELFYNTIIERDYPWAIGQRFTGAFLSQARRTSFVDLVEAVVHYYGGRDQDLENCFIWLDMFGANQPRLCSEDSLTAEEQTEREYILSSGLHYAIGSFEDCLFFFNSWKYPLLLQRAWCVWEIYGAVRCKRDIKIIFTPGEDEKFLETLLNDYEAISKNNTDIDMRKADCFKKTDRDMIHAEVRKLDRGFVTLNAAVLAKIRQWLVEKALKAVEAERNVPNRDDHRFAKLCCSSGQLLSDQAEHALALQLYEESLTIRVSLSSRTSTEAIQTTLFIAKTLKSLERFQEAIEHANEALLLLEQEPTDEHNEEVPTSPSCEPGLKAQAYQTLGWTFQAMGQYCDALERYEMALAVYEDMEEQENSEGKGTVLHDMAITYSSLRNAERALDLFKQALQIFSETLGANHPRVAGVLANIAEVFADQNDLKLALKSLNRALDIYREKCGEVHPLVASTLHIKGFLLLKKQRRKYYKQALECFKDSKAISEQRLGEAHDNVAGTIHCMGNAYFLLGYFDKAVEKLQESINITIQKSNGKPHPSLASTYYSIGIVHRNNGKPKLARENLMRSLTVYEESLGLDNAKTMEVLEMVEQSIMQPSFQLLDWNQQNEQEEQQQQEEIDAIE